jgi:diguanylate cyclase (GGDEF)-like protein
MNVRRMLVVACVAAMSIGIGAAEERGYPIIKVYGQQEHGGGGQSFAIAQDVAGRLHFANLYGVITYDGARWRTTTLPRDSAAYAIAVDARGRVATGGVGEIGFLVTDGAGNMRFQSIVRELPTTARDVGDLRAVVPYERGALFLTDHFLIINDGTSTRAVADLRRAASVPRHAFRAGGDVWFAGDDGLSKLEPRTFRIVPASFTRKQIDLVQDAGGGRVIVAVRNEGLFTITHGNAEPFAPAASQWLRGKVITSGTLLQDGRLVIATREDGLLFLEPNGEPNQLIDQDAGLPDEVVSAASLERDGALWVALHGGIARIEVSSPLTLFDRRTGVKGAISTVLRHDGALYVGSSHGLYVLDPKARAGAMSTVNVAHRIDGVPGTVWELMNDGADMLAATTDGVYQVHADGTSAVIPGTAHAVTYTLLRSITDPSRTWMSTRKSLATLRHCGAAGAPPCRANDRTTWSYEGPVAGSPRYGRTMLERDGFLWCGTVFDGAIRIKIDGGEPRLTQYGTGEIAVSEVGGDIVLTRNPAEIFHPTANGGIERDPRLAHLGAPANFFRTIEDARGNAWVNARPPMFARRLADGRYGTAERIVAISATHVALIRGEADGTVWLGSDDRGLFRFRPAVAVAAGAPPRPTLHVSNAARELGHGFGRLRIEFAPMTYRSGTEYQYRLDPIDNAWSSWSSETFIDYTNLGEGDYTFQLRTRGGGSDVSPIATWSFRVLPPWYRTTWAMLLAIALIAAIVALLVVLRTRALSRQAALLREKIAERTDELRQANGRLERLSLLDELTGIANRRYFQRALADDWERARDRQLPLALILIDIDHFKELNDSRGHQAGDACLRQIGSFLAQQLRRSGDLSVRAGDVVARYGGEEFVVLLTDSDGSEALRSAERLRAGIEALAMPYAGTTLRVTASCGVASIVPSANESIETLIGRADRGLYTAKNGGRNRVEYADDETQIAS